MKFYDTLQDLNLNKKSLPDNVVKKLMFYEYQSHNGTCDLDTIWNVVNDVCKDCVDWEYIKNIGLDIFQLLKDIFAYSVITVYSSIVYKEESDMSYRKSLGVILNKTSNELLGELKYGDSLKKWADINDQLLTRRQPHLCDFYCAWNSFVKYSNYGYEINSYDIKMFFYIIDNWINCPYNTRHIMGITFKKISKFFENITKVINSDDFISCCLKYYETERIFNITFIYQLTVFIKEKYSQSDIFEGSIHNESAARDIYDLASLVSLPLAFSRHNYIEKLYGCYNNREIVIKNFTSYICGFVIPLYGNVYEFLIISMAQSDVNTIKKVLEKFIIDNKQYFNYDKVKESINKIKDIDLSSEVQINITELIYNFSFDGRERNDGNIEKINENSVKSFSEVKYNYQNYYLNFPYNNIYNTYNINKMRKNK